MRTRVWGKSVVSGVASITRLSLRRDDARHRIGLFSWRHFFSVVGLSFLLMGCRAEAPDNFQNQSAGGNSARQSGITPPAAAAQFKAGEAGLEGYTRLSGAEVRSLLVGHVLRNRGPVFYSDTEHFMRDGRVIVMVDNGRENRPYLIAGDAMCEDMGRGWVCRRFYRNREGLLFQVFGNVQNTPLPIRVR